MLQKLKDHSGRWYGKALFILIVVGFSMWGIVDIVLNYINMRPVATVDGHNISQEEFAAQLQASISKNQELSKGQLTPDQIKDLGIVHKALDTLIDHYLIVSEMKKRHLVVTDAAVKRRIQSIPAFVNEQGTFDRRAFDYLLQTNHITENQFIADVRLDLQHQQIFGALFAGIHLPKTYVDTLFQGFFEQRVFAVVTVPYSKMVVKDAPKDSDLLKFYKENQTLFTQPEMRKITLLEIDPKVLKDRVNITQDKLQDEYERRKAEFETAEKREIKQINLKDEETAKKAAESIKKGRPVPAVARDFGAEFKDLGLVTKQQVPDIAADKLFESELGQITGPISTPFGWQVYVVSKIEPSFTKSFVEMRTQLESELKTQLANDQVYELKNKIEDALAGGATLSEIAKENNFKVQTIDAVSKSGKDTNDKSVLPDVGKAEIIEQAYSLTEGADSPTIDTKDGISYVVHVDSIQPAHVPPFEKIKAKVMQAWYDQKRFELSTYVAQQLAKDARSVADLTRLALGRKLSIKMLDPLSRIDSETNEKIHKQFTPRLVKQMFELVHGKAVFGPTPEISGGGVQIIMLQKVLPFDQKSLKDKKEQMQKKLSELAFTDATALYMKYLRSQAKISINKSVYEAIANRG